MTAATTHRNHSTDIESTAKPARTGTALAGGLVFLVSYLAVGPVAGALQDRDAPLPDDPAADTVAYLSANSGAALSTAVLQVVSVLGFAVFLTALVPALRSLSAVTASRLRTVGWVSVAAMLVSCGIAVATLALVDSASADTIGTLRMANFYAGGVGNVATLGVVVYGAARLLGRAAVVGRPTTWLGYVAGVLAMLSVLSLPFYYANAFLPLGRTLSMVWAVVAAVSLVRSRRS